MTPEIARAAMTQEERQLRARLAQMFHGDGLLHGSLVLRQRLCGKPSCRCAHGEKHEALILTVRSEGRVEQIYIPRPLEATVRRWVEQDQRMRQMLGDLSKLHAEKIRELKRQGGRSSGGS